MLYQHHVVFSQLQAYISYFLACVVLQSPSLH